jgi:hypothetical protein
MASHAPTASRPRRSRVTSLSELPFGLVAPAGRGGRRTAGNVEIDRDAGRGRRGKVIMHEAGVFDGVDVAMMIHPFDETVPFVEFAGRVPLTVIFHGLSAHAGPMPERGVSAHGAAKL